jgi:hypothetical protein
MRTCAELADIGMQLARLAAARAFADEAEREQSRASVPQPDNAADPPPDTIAEPLSIHAAEPPSPVTPQPRAPATYLRAPSCKPIDPALLFIRLSAMVRDCLALERLLADGVTGHIPRPIAAAPPADPRREELREAFRLVTENRPGGADLLREATACLDEQLANDPDQTRDIPDLFFSICDAAGIVIDLAKMADDYRATGADHRIDPRATSPP